MPIVRIPFGEGLQRADGRMVVRPTSFDDIRNCYQYEGKAQARKGYQLISTLIDDVAANLDETIAVGPLRSENATIAIGYATSDSELHVNRLTFEGLNPVHVGSLGTLPATATWDPPIYIMADADAKVIMAHDEPAFLSRIVTQYYDPFASPNIQTLQADLDGNGLADVYFRGVARHLGYIFGWGFGSATPGDDDRPDVVRVSDAGNPVSFRDDAFFEVGQRGEAVLTCKTAGQFLLVFKETETFQIFGYSPDTFGIRPADTLYGCVGSRLAVSVGNVVFFWSVQGPRMFTAGTGESVDLAVPLDIDGPAPSTLIDESDPHEAFAAYDPVTRVVNFIWGQRVYALSIRNPNMPRWSYYELGDFFRSGSDIFNTITNQGTGDPPADGPIFDLTTPFPTINDLDVTADIDNTTDQAGGLGGATGGELIKVWSRLSPSGSWSLKQTVEATLAASQLVVFDNLLPNTAYDFAIRYRRGGAYNPSSTTLPPTTWDADAQETVTTTVSTPTLVTRGTNNGVWQVPSAGNDQITIDWTIPTGHEGLQIELERRVRTEGNTAIQDVDGNGIGPADTSDPSPGAWTAVATLAAGTTQYTDTGITSSRWNDYRIRFVGGVAWSATLECWAGPDAPQDNSWTATGDGVSNFISGGWVNATAPLGRVSCPGPSNAPANHHTLYYQNNMAADPSSDNWVVGLPAEREAPFATSGSITVIPTPSTDGETIRVALRHEVSCFGTIYPSYWARKSGTPNYIVTTAGVIE